MTKIGIMGHSLGAIAAAVAAELPGVELVPIEPGRERGGALHVHEPDPNELAEAEMRRLRTRRRGPTEADLAAIAAAEEKRRRKNAKRLETNKKELDQIAEKIINEVLREEGRGA